MNTYFYDDPNNATPLGRGPLFYSADRADGFRARFLGWAEPRGLEIPATAGELESWVGRYTAETGDDTGADDYLMRETT